MGRRARFLAATAATLALAGGALTVCASGGGSKPPSELRVPSAYEPNSPSHGVRQNVAFEAVVADGRHLFVGLAGALVQDGPAAGVRQVAAPLPCSKVWVGHEIEMQEFLRTARITRVEEVPIGVTKPKRAFFEPGGPIESAAWKPLRPLVRRGFMESYKAEIAAYELDKLLGLQMVPPYVERRIDGEYGAISLWVEHVQGWDIEHPVKGPDPLAWNRQVVRMKLFDMLIGNIDRNQGNLLYDSEYHLILIDHSRAFTTIKDLSKMGRISKVDRELWNRMLELDEAQLTTVLHRWISGSDIRAILTRRDRMQAEIARLVTARGEAAVFLP